MRSTCEKKSADEEESNVHIWTYDTYGCFGQPLSWPDDSRLAGRAWQGSAARSQHVGIRLFGKSEHPPVRGASPPEFRPPADGLESIIGLTVQKMACSGRC